MYGRVRTFGLGRGVGRAVVSGLSTGIIFGRKRFGVLGVARESQKLDG